MIVLGDNILLEAVETPVEKQDGLYVSASNSNKIKIGIFFRAGQSSAIHLAKGSKVHYDSTNQRAITLDGKEYIIIPDKDALIYE